MDFIGILLGPALLFAPIVWFCIYVIRKGWLARFRSSLHSRDFATAGGRGLLAIIFLLSGLAKIPGWEATQAYMSSHGMPWVQLLLFGAIFLEVIGGAFLIAGFRARTTATLLAIYLIPVTLIFHGFWNYFGADAQTQVVNFLKNVAIFGGLLRIGSDGPGAYSVDYVIARRNLNRSMNRESRIRVAS